MLLLKWGETTSLQEFGGWGEVLCPSLVAWKLRAWADRLLRAPWPRPMTSGTGSEGHGRPGLPPPLCLHVGSTEAGRNASLAADMKALCEWVAEWVFHVASQPERRTTGIQMGWLELTAPHLPPAGFLGPRISLWSTRPGAPSCCQEKQSHKRGRH